MQRTALLFLFAAGCTSRTVPDFPIGEDIKSIVYVVEAEGAPPALYAVGGGVFRYPIVVGEGARVTAIPYVYELEELQLAPGPIAIDAAAGKNETRRLPPAAVYTRATGEEAWLPLDTIPDSILALGLPQFDGARCINDGGCYDAALSICAIPCEVEPRIGRDDVEPVRAIERRDRSCVAPWERSTATEMIHCVPPIWPDPIACRIDQYRLPGDVGCTAIDVALVYTPNALQIVNPVDLDTALADANLAAAGGIAVEIILGNTPYQMTANATISGDIAIFGGGVASTSIRAEQRVLYFGSGRLHISNLSTDGLSIESAPGSMLALSGVHVAGVRRSLVEGHLQLEHSVILAAINVRGLDSDATVSHTLFGAESPAPVPALPAGMTIVGGAGFFTRVAAIDRYFAFSNARVTIDELYLRALRMDDRWGVGISGGSKVTITRFAGNVRTGALQVIASTATVTDLHLEGGGADRYAIDTNPGGELTLDGAYVDGFDVGVSNNDGVQRLNDIELSNIRCAICVESGDTEAHRVTFRDITQHSLGSKDRLRTFDVDIERSLRAIDANEEADVQVTRVTIREAQNGIAVSRYAKAAISDLIMDNVGLGAELHYGGSLILERAEVSGLETEGFFADGACSALTIRDAIISDPPNSSRGRAMVYAKTSASLELDRVIFNQVEGAILIENSAETTSTCADGATSYLVRNVLVSGARGSALHADLREPGSMITVERTEIEDTGGSGIEILRAPHVELRDLLISRSAGAGISLAGGGMVHLERFELAQNEQLAIEIDRSDDPVLETSLEVSARHGVLSGRSGILVRRSAGFDVLEILDHVRFDGVIEPLRLEE